MAIEATHELVRPGQRDAYMASTLPVSDESGDPMDFSDASYENLRNCASGVASIWDDHAVAVAAIDRDPQFNVFAPPYKNLKIQQARQAVANRTIKSLARIETIAESAEQEADQLSGRRTPRDWRGPRSRLRRLAAREVFRR